MKTSDNAFTQWVFPLLFIGCAGWAIWHGATYIMAGTRRPVLELVVELLERRVLEALVEQRLVV